MRIAKICLIIIASLCFSRLYSVRISARVCSISGSPLAGVSVYDGKRLILTDDSGHFSIDTQADSLHFTRLGYEPLSLHTQTIMDEVVMIDQELKLPVIRVWDRAEQASLQTVNSSLIYPDTNSGSSSAADLLLRHSAFGSADVPLSGEYQSVSLLGGLSRHSLVMLDGVALNSPGEAFDLSRIPASQISHIEIIKGASSVYGGSSAISGIINIVTKNPQSRLGFELEGGMGSFDLYSQRYRSYFASERLSLSAEYSHYEAENDFPYETDFATEDSPRRVNNSKAADYFFFKAAYGSENSYYQAVVNYDSYRRQLPGPVSFPMLYDDARQTGSNLLSKLSWVHKKGEFNLESILAVDIKEKTYANLESSSPFARAHEGQDYVSPLWQNKLSYLRGPLALSLSGELNPIYYRYQNLLQEAADGFERYDNAALSAGVKYESGISLVQHSTALAIRQDWAQQERHPSWRIEEQLSFYLPIEIALKANLGTAFSLPSLFDLHYIGDSQTQTSPDLKSESSFGWDLGISFSHALFLLEAAYYRSEVDNLIQWRQYFFNGSTWRPFNVGKAEIENWEFRMQVFPLKNLRLEADLLLSEARDRSRREDGSLAATYGKYLPYSPKNRSAFSVVYETPGYGVSMIYNRVGEQYSTVDNLAGAMPAFDALNLHGYLHKDIGDFGARISLQLNNIQDNSYEIYAHIPQPGFSWRAGLMLSYQLGL